MIYAILLRMAQWKYTMDDKEHLSNWPQFFAALDNETTFARLDLYDVGSVGTAPGECIPVFKRKLVPKLDIYIVQGSCQAFVILKTIVRWL